MRDLLTILAGLAIAVLAAAVIVPPLFDWDAHRPAIDAAIARAAGTPVETGGRIRIRLLPTPRLEVEHLRLGSQATTEPSLAASAVETEIALTPLLHGEVRFLEARIGRAEIRVPTGAEGDWRIPRELLADPVLRREWAFDDVVIGRLLITAIVPSTGRTDQFFAEGVAIQGGSLAGPWRVEGRSGTVPFQLVTGELGADRTLQVKLSGGGDQNPRFEADARLSFAPGPSATLVPALAGTAKVLLGPPAQVAASGLPIPVQIQAGFSAAAKTIELEAVSIEAGTGGASVRLGGTGTIEGDEPRIRFSLEGRRIDIDSFILSPSGAALAERATGWGPPRLPVPIEFEIKLDSIGLAQEELTNASVRATLAEGEIHIERAEVSGPGQTRLSASGDIRPLRDWATSGRVAFASTASDRFGRYLARLGVPSRFVTPLDGRRLDAAADLVINTAVSSFRNLNIKLGDSSLTGAGRYTPPESGVRGRFEAQIALQGLDLAASPPLGGLFDAIQNVDLGLIVDARGLGYGGRAGAGRISARVSSDGDSLLVERLEVADVAGANASVSGRIAPDGSGRIEGRLTAARAAPLVDLLGQVWLGGLSSLSPAFLRDGPLDLSVLGERALDPRNAAPGLNTALRGTAGGGRFDADVFTQGGAVQTLSATLATDRAGAWLGVADSSAALRRPATVDLRGTRLASGQFTVTLAGDIAGLKLSTRRPFALGKSDDVVEAGEADLAVADLTPFLSVIGDGVAAGAPIPAELQLTIGRERDAAEFMLSGRLAGETLEARLSVPSVAEVTGTLSVSRLSLPWLAGALALNAPPPPPGSVWSTARFGALRTGLLGGRVSVRATSLDLGRGLVGQDGAFRAVLSPNGLSLRDIAFGLGGGRVAATLALSRQGGLAAIVAEGTLTGIPASILTGSGGIEAKLSGTLQVGGSGETPATLVANLGGSGSLQLADIEAPAADPGAVARAAARALKDADPLATRRLEGIVTEELARGPFRGAAPSASATVVGGALRIGPLTVTAPQGRWEGVATIDFKTLSLEARGNMIATAGPAGWSGNPPYILLGWRGPLTAPRRDIDVAPLTNGLASIVLQRELDKMETFEADVSERARINSRREMDQARIAAEEAARQRLAREQADAERLRLAEEAARQAAARAREQQAPSLFAPPDPSSRLPTLRDLPPPTEIRPAPQIRLPSPGG